MKSIKNMGYLPAGESLVADELLELHAARLLLLFRCCGTKSRKSGSRGINGLTKMAKLDFFVRYPQFFAEVCKRLGRRIDRLVNTTESAMVRFHYGPWDKRYYHVLAYLEGRKLLVATRIGSGYYLGLTEAGEDLSNRLLESSDFDELQEQMIQVRKVLGGKSGSFLKNLIYETFEEQVAKRQLGEVIH
jgi:hypothetical protein